MIRSKLLPFLQTALEKKRFENLQWDDKNHETFSLHFTRYDKNKYSQLNEKKKHLLQVHERILKEWYIVTGKSYPGYSIARASFISSLNASVYLMPVKRDVKLQYRFANNIEIKENRRKKKEKGKVRISDSSPDDSILQTEPTNELNSQFISESNLIPPDPPPSNSSGYQSALEDEENMDVLGDQNENSFEANDENMKDLIDFLDDLISNPEKHADFYKSLVDNEEYVPKNEKPGLESTSYNKGPTDVLKILNQPYEPEYQGQLGQPSSIGLSFEDKPGENEKPGLESASYKDPTDVLKILNQPYEPQYQGQLGQPSLIGLSFGEKPGENDLPLPAEETQTPVMSLTDELNAHIIDTSSFLVKYWLCTKKLYVGSTLVLICEKQFFPKENQGITEGQIVIPNNVFEPGVYKLEKSFEIDGKYFIFCLPDNNQI